MKSLWISLFFGILFTISAALLPEESSCKRISPQIVNDIKDFIELIPQADIEVIVAKHLVLDSNFRHAVEYLKSSRFTDMLDKVQKEPEIEDLLDFLRVTEPCNGLELDVPYLEIVLLEAMENEQYMRHGRRYRRNTEESTLNLSTFTGFVRELLEHLPRNKYDQLIKSKCAANSQFAAFYGALRSTDFKPKLEATASCANVAPYVKTLNSNAIDVKSLLPIVYEVISWGPNV